MKIKRSARYNIPLLNILMLFSVTFFIYNDFNIRMIIGYSVLIISAFLYFTLDEKMISITKTKRSYLILAIIISIYSIMGGQEDIGVYVMAVLICALFVMISNIDERQVRSSMKMLFIACAVFSIYIISVKIDPDIYYLFTRNMISSQSVVMNDRLLMDGYGITLGGNIVFIDYVLTLGIMLAINTIFAYKNQLKHRWIYYLFILICVVGMLFENRKSELLAAFVGCCFSFRAQMSISTSMDRISSKRRLLFITVIVFAFLVYLGTAGFLDRYLIFLERLTNNYRSSNKVDVTSGRTFLWSIAFNLFKQNPVFGIGWANFKNYIPSYLGHIDNVHNNYIQLLCETGVIGFILVVAPMLHLLILTVKNTKNYLGKENRNPLSMVTNITSYGLQISFFVLSFLDPCWYKMSFWPFFAIAIMLSSSSSTFNGELQND